MISYQGLGNIDLIPLDIIYKVVIFFAILLVTWAIVIIVDRVLKKILIGTYPAVSASIRRFISIFLWLLGILVALSQIGLTLEILLVIITITGIGAIVASRDVIENIIAKYFSDAYIPFNKGDTIRMGNYEGEVIEINPIATVLLNEKGEMISIPNSKFMKEITVNLSPAAWKKVVIPISLPAGLNIAEFENSLLRYMYRIKHLLDEHFQPLLTVKSKTSSSYELALTFMVNDKNKREQVVNQVNMKIMEIIEELRRKSK